MVTPHVAANKKALAQGGWWVEELPSAKPETVTGEVTITLPPSTTETIVSDELNHKGEPGEEPKQPDPETESESTTGEQPESKQVEEPAVEPKKPGRKPKN